VKNKPAVVLRHGDVISFLSASYLFEKQEGKVGELCTSQLAITSDAMTASAPLIVSEIRIEFEGSMKPIVLVNDESIGTTIDTKPVSLTRVLLKDVFPDNEDANTMSSAHRGRPILSGMAGLTLQPGQTRVLELKSLLREAGDAIATSVTFSIVSELFDLDFVQMFDATARPDAWWGERSAKKKLVRVNPSSITILPKPPKLELRFVELQEQYYTNEHIKLHLEVVNEEDSDCIANLDVRLLGDAAPTIQLRFALPTDATIEDLENDTSHDLVVGKISTATSMFIDILISPVDLPGSYELSIKASYNLVSDMETPISKSVAAQLSVINPFEANYDFSPRLHPNPWPSFFSHEEAEDARADLVCERAYGLSQKWCLTCRYFSFAAEDLIIDDLDIQIIGTNGGIQSSTKQTSTIPESGIRVSPKSLDEAEFDVFTQKSSLDDRGTATLDVSLAIRWRRDEADSVTNTTVLAVPRLLVSSSEPRVLATVSYSATIPSTVHFDVTIENPSNHFLTFGLAMEPSEKFAFSGVKQSTLQLVPLSRRTMRFRLVPFIRGDWIGPIRCTIKDRYFQKTLKIAPTEGMKADKEGILIWVPAEEEL
jgi:hypothetical protein